MSLNAQLILGKLQRFAAKMIKQFFLNDIWTRLKLFFDLNCFIVKRVHELISQIYSISKFQGESGRSTCSKIRANTVNLNFR